MSWRYGYGYGYPHNGYYQQRNYYSPPPHGAHGAHYRTHGGYYGYQQRGYNGYYRPQSRGYNGHYRRHPGYGYGYQHPGYDDDYDGYGYGYQSPGSGHSYRQSYGHPAKCQYPRCPAPITNPAYRFCDFHVRYAATGDYGQQHTYNPFGQRAYGKYSPYGEYAFPGPGGGQEQPSYRALREIDKDNWPRALKCQTCKQIYNDPVTFTNPRTGTHHISCSDCVDATLGYRPGLFSRRVQVQREPRIPALHSAFVRLFSGLIGSEAPRQVCYFCSKVMTCPVVTCHDVPPQFWSFAPHATPDANGVVSHAFCKACLQKYRFADGADAAQCPFRDACWAATEVFPESQEYSLEARTIAARAWEKTIRMAYQGY
ncbi:hypothetical protein Dda_4185 [Drechslerella dactyloides]|uniref:Uncharacterized protein n=1 Tax=Drechslerella dactyloides TaxID=74499 RepID=A0AAD6IZC7_DREDA|nr:hypothetical protein Dda_4185 [Drechslerella dactyloides]